MKKFMIVVGLFALLLAGCASVPEPTPVSTVTETVTLMPTKTEPLVPTEISEPKATPTRAPFEEPEGLYEQSISPDGQWVAWSGFGDIDDEPHVIVENKDRTSRWFIFQEDLFGELLCRPDCYLIIHFVHWSTDGRYGYIAGDIPIDGPVYLGPYVAHIIQLDLKSGEKEYIHLDGAMHAYDFSSDDLMVYTSRDEGDRDYLIIVDLESGNPQQIKLDLPDIEEIGILVWLPNGAGILFVTRYDSLYNDKDIYPFSIWYFDLSTLSAKEIYNTWECEVTRPQWISQAELQYGCQWYSISESSLILNIDTWEVTEVEE